MVRTVRPSRLRVAVWHVSRRIDREGMTMDSAPSNDNCVLWPGLALPPMLYGDTARVLALAKPRASAGERGARGLSRHDSVRRYDEWACIATLGVATLQGLFGRCRAICPAKDGGPALSRSPWRQPRASYSLPPPRLEPLPRRRDAQHVFGEHHDGISLSRSGLPSPRSCDIGSETRTSALRHWA